MQVPSWDLCFKWALSKIKGNKQRFPSTGSRHYLGIKKNPKVGCRNETSQGIYWAFCSLESLVRLATKKQCFVLELSLPVMESTWIKHDRAAHDENTSQRMRGVSIWFVPELTICAGSLDKMLLLMDFSRSSQRFNRLNIWSFIIFFSTKITTRQLGLFFYFILLNLAFLFFSFLLICFSSFLW